MDRRTGDRDVASPAPALCHVMGGTHTGQKRSDALASSGTAILACSVSQK